MQAQVGSGIQMAIVINSGMLMRLKMGCGVKRKDMMFMIEFVSEHFPVKRPTECVRQHGNEQYQHDGIHMAALAHGFGDSIPWKEGCQQMFFRQLPHQLAPPQGFVQGVQNQPLRQTRP
jgi:hypothetical protein